MKNSKSYLKTIILCLIFFGISFNAHTQIEIAYETEIFVCSPLGVLENASFNCAFNGTLSYEIIGDPEGLIEIASPVDVVDGAFSFLYTIDAPAPDLVEVIWTIETSDDASGCAAVGAAISTFMPIDCQCAPVIQNLPITHESCYQCADGSAELIASGMQGPITYLWSNGATKSKIENLAPGTYNLTATGSNIESCEAFGTITVNAYECATTQIEYSNSQILCNGDCDGTIDIFGLQNGNEITTVLWSDGSTDLVRQQLCPGIYICTVTTEDNCPYMIEVNLEEPVLLEVEAKNIIHADGSNSGSITLAASGGLAPYAYFISQDGESIDHDDTESEVNNLDPGCYDILVIDANGCTANQDSVCVDNISTILSITDSEFSIYPNPCSSHLNIKKDNNYLIKEIMIYDILGKRQAYYSKDNQIQVDQLKNGIYIIDIVTDQGHWIKQFVKSNEF